MDRTEATADRHELVVSRREQGMRLDRFLGNRCNLGRRKVRRLLDAHRVHLDETKARPGTKLQAGWSVRTDFDPSMIADQGPMPAPVDSVVVVEETPEFIVLDKPAGIASVALDPFETGSLANHLAATHPVCIQAALQAQAHPLEAGLVHRLDRETSGLIVAAKTAKTYLRLRESSSHGHFSKTYLALVEGKMEGSGIIDQPMRTLRHNPRKMGPAEGPGALEARSRFRVIESSQRCSLVEVTLTRGRPHQVRFHLSFLGHPILGDHLYDGHPAPSNLGRNLLLRCVSLRALAVKVDVTLPPPQDWLDHVSTKKM